MLLGRQRTDWVDVATALAEVDVPNDAELIRTVRNAPVSAYGSLYERHIASA